MPIFDVERKILNDNASFSSSKDAFVTSLEKQIEKLKKTNVTDDTFTDIYLEDLCEQIQNALPQGTLKTLLEHPEENDFLKVKRIGYTENTKTFDASRLQGGSLANVTTIQDFTTTWETPNDKSTPAQKKEIIGTPHNRLLFADAAALVNDPEKYVSLLSTKQQFNKTKLDNGEYYERFNLNNCFGVQLIELDHLDLKKLKNPNNENDFGVFDFDMWDQGGIKEKDGTFSMDYGCSTFESENDIKLKNYFFPAEEYLLFKRSEIGKLHNETLFSKEVIKETKKERKIKLNFGSKKDIDEDILWMTPGLLVVVKPMTQKSNTFVGKIIGDEENILIEVKTNGYVSDLPGVPKKRYKIYQFPRLLFPQTVNYLQTKYKQGLLAKRLWFKNKSNKVYFCTSVIYSLTRQLYEPLDKKEFSFKAEDRTISGEKSVLADQSGNIETTNPGEFTRYKLNTIFGNKTKKALNNGNKKNFYDKGVIIGVNEIDFDTFFRALDVNQDFELLSKQFLWPNTPTKPNRFDIDNPTEGLKKYIEVVFKMSYP